jgi:hypothetical protein
VPLESLQSAFELGLTAEIALPVVHPCGRKAEIRTLGARRAERSRGLQLRVLMQDCLFERGELGARVEAQFCGKQLAPAPDSGERIPLSPLAILRMAEDHPTTLAQRRLGDPGASLGGSILHIAGLQFRIQNGLFGGEADLIQPERLDARRLPVGQLGERRAAPEPQSFRKRMRGAVGLIKLEQV